jgi:hypothetical protein
MDGEHGPVEPAAHGLVLAFDTEGAEFAWGFEAGGLWADPRSSDEALEAVVHAANSEMVLRMGEALGRAVVGEQLDGTWTRVTFAAPGSTAEPSPGPGDP